MAGNKSLDNITFHKNAATPAIGLEYAVTADASTLSVDFVGSGTFTSVVEIKTLSNSDWDERIAFDTKTCDMSTTPSNFNTWEVDITGISYIRVRLTSVNGNITVLGKVVG